MSSDDDRCEMTELLKSECSHCKRHEEQVERPLLGPITVAEYEGVCDSCGDDIRPGDHIGKSGDGWVHYGCGR